MSNIHLFLRTWLAFKVRKGQKEALKASGRHDSMSHPTSKFYCKTLKYIEEAGFIILRAEV
jgi:hypothetical protein